MKDAIIFYGIGIFAVIGLAWYLYKSFKGESKCAGCPKRGVCKREE
ncbi:hypothetical protein GF327_07570 [Candidatus Woesearchaeota archaeon]|nr:hypothetical protein [Candidatus Woesearchaeota archaeon]